MIYSKKDILIYKLDTVLSNSNFRWIAITIFIMLIGLGLFLCFYQGLDGKKRPSKKKIIFGICSCLIGSILLISFFSIYRSVKEKVINPQEIIKTNKVCIEKGKIISIQGDGYTSTYKIKLNKGHDVINVNSNSKPLSKSDMRQIVTYYPYVGTTLDQKLALTAKVGEPVKIVSDKYDYKFANHNQFGVPNQDYNLNNLNQSKINSVVKTND